MNTGTATGPALNATHPGIIEPSAISSEPDEVLTSADFRYRFTIADFERLHLLGFIDEDEQRFELLDGDLIPISRLLPPHASCVNRLTRLFTLGLGLRASVVVQNPIVLAERVQPQPDLTVARFREDGYEAAHPRPEDVELVVEVMDSTHRRDRGVKLPLYAGKALRETWLVDLPGGILEVHRKPVAGVYSEILLLRRGQSIAPEAFPDLVLAVDTILGRAES